MSEDIIKIEIDGKPLMVRKGAMLMQVADEAGIYIPRFCYHKKLSVAANCRMCLVEVERAPKPLPACATPVTDDMKVYTASAKAVAAQKSTMEFLLINHPLDCPICDQGGECELQDMAMGYGQDVSRFTERKRVVKDKDIGPLIATDMTRCIHCTRCVRFGEEIAGLRELGATGRGEHMEIGTYIAHSIVSELSGNVIDLCPVGALTAKPSRYSGRSWEYVQHPAVSPHDSVGANIYLHTIRGKVMRVVPRENEAVNETWIADRDRFSYEGLYSDERALQPLISAEAAEWQAALATTRAGLQAVIDQHGPEAVGFLLSPTATLEELYLAQKLARGLGVANIDHRLRQADFSDPDSDPVFPWLGQSLEELERLDAALLIGSNVRMEQPLAGHRLRKAALSGAKIMFINPRDFDFRFPVADKIIADPAGMLTALAAVAKAVADSKGVAIPDNLTAVTASIIAGPVEQRIAEALLASQWPTLLLGNQAVMHPAFTQLRALAVFIARTSGASLGYLPDGGNAVGAWLAGATPHRLAGGTPTPVTGLAARAMLDSPRKAYVLLGVEPEFDCWDTAAALTAVQQAEFVVALTPFVSAAMKTYADVILPTGAFPETAGTYVNAEGRWQTFRGAVKPPGEARPAWKVLRVLGNTFDLSGFDYLDAQQISTEVQKICAQARPDNLIDSTQCFGPYVTTEPMRVADTPIYAVDAIVRRAGSLQRTPLNRSAEAVLNPAFAEQLGLLDYQRVWVQQNGNAATLPLTLDASVPEGCVWIATGLADSSLLGPSTGPVEISAA